MDTEEKVLWVFILWTLSLGVTAWLFGSIFTGWHPTWTTSPAILFPAFFMPVLVAWLFRVTYLSGRNS